MYHLEKASKRLYSNIILLCALRSCLYRLNNSSQSKKLKVVETKIKGRSIFEKMLSIKSKATITFIDRS